MYDIWQGSQDVCATETESSSQNIQMMAVGCISDTEDIVKASWSNFQHHGAAAFTLSEGSPLISALPIKILCGG
jgi:hypothetical protein